MLSALGVNEQSVLLVMAEKNIPVWKSVHNLAAGEVAAERLLNVRDLLSHDMLLLTQDAVVPSKTGWATVPSQAAGAKRRRHNHASYTKFSSARSSPKRR